MAKVLEILQKIDKNKFLIPLDYKIGMKVPGIIYINEEILKYMEGDSSFEQVANVATLPGIELASIAMPDIHWGYGFPIGGVAAFDIDYGVIVPGGIGYDINCGVRLINSNLRKEEVLKVRDKLSTELFNNIPVGVGTKGKIKLTEKNFKELICRGAEYMVDAGFGIKEDLNFIEENGRLKDASFEYVGAKSIERGLPEVGTLGAGNHFLEVQEVSEIYDEQLASKFKLREGYITILIHTGSRGFGHQIASDYIKEMERATQKYGISVPDRQLACAPFKSKEGEAYYKSMCAAANYAWANRQAITFWIRESFEKVFSKKWESLGLHIIYDVAHNIAKIENHSIKGKQKKVVVHRKGATRAFPANTEGVPEYYKDTGHPVLIPGDMGTESFVVVGEKKVLTETFGSSCHGAGRLLSRSAASKKVNLGKLLNDLKESNISILSKNKEGLKEEAPEAYKDVEKVINALEEIKLIKKVAKMKPLIVIKG
jgi:tRNA-splicing ligase RtcB